jgi:hypothetical protein
MNRQSPEFLLPLVKKPTLFLKKSAKIRFVNPHGNGGGQNKST